MKKILVAAMTLCVLSSCGSPRRLVILHANDTHSHFEVERAGSKAGLGGILERAAFVDSVRTADGAGNVLLLHAGDFSQGSSYFTELGGMLEVEMLDAMGYDAVTLGNHEFDNDVDALAGRLAKLKHTQVVCANLDLSMFELGRYVKPYAVFERGGFRVGVIGIDARLVGNVTRAVTDHLVQLDDASVVNRWARHLRENERCNLVILLSHRGYSEDQELVPQISGVDFVIGGHSHTFVDDVLYVRDADGKSVGIVSDGFWGIQMGKLTVR
ncbi:MAG: metallophosphoesterase [Bacteroidales bacterium]|nr:metallophosphoesterase [Bacteroidales bacterium]